MDRTTPLCIADHCRIRDRHVPDCTEDDCRGCLPRRADDGLRLCSVCARRIAEDARTAAILYQDLELTLIRRGRGTERTSGGGYGAPAPDDDVMEARTAIRSTLVTLCRTVADERGISLPPNDVVAFGEYLARHSVWLAAHPAADEHAKDLRDIASDPRTRRLAYPSGSDRLYIGDCPLVVYDLDGDEEVCGTRLHQYADQLLLTCSGCGTEETVEWWQRKIVGDASALVDAYAAAADLALRWYRPVDPALIRKWASLGKVERKGKDDKGRTLYALDELRRYAETLWRVAA